jgi:2-(1,2-epoxy-1,2-dihydrophenyl)acetyl-CoA isomerase
MKTMSGGQISAMDINTGTNDLLASLDANVLTLTMNRPDARNAMSGAMTNEAPRRLISCTHLLR